MAYAATTTVPIERSKAEIESMVARYGARAFQSGWCDDGRAMVEFMAHNRRLRFVVNAPDPMAEQFTHRAHSSGRKIERPAGEARSLWEQACRARWRALCLCIKAKLEAVESGITSFEVEFMPYVVLPGGKTAGQHMTPLIEQAYATNQVPQLGFEGGSP